jgi:hypothetical protein
MAASLRAVLKSQYHAALAMLRDAIEKCPDEIWDGGKHTRPVWHVAYHTLFFTHLYLQPNEEAFRPWEHHRKEHQILASSVPWPPHYPTAVPEPYTKAEVLDYWNVCDGLVDAAVEDLDLDASDCGFFWYKMPKLEHQVMNIRHAQHHAAQIADRVRLAADIGVEWVGGKA